MTTKKSTSTKRKTKKKRVKKPKARPLAVITADTHLHPLTWASRPSLRGDAFFAFKQIVDYCCANDVPNLIIAGDVLDRRINDAETPRVLRELLETADECDVQVYYIQGQHDVQQGEPWLGSLSNRPIHLHRALWRIGQYSIYGIDWTPASGVEEELCLIPEAADLVVMHQVCTDFMGSVVECELNCAEVPNGKLLILGDYHVHTQCRVPMTDGRETLLLSPGSISLRSINEEPEKHFFVLNDDLSVESVRLLGRDVLVAPDIVLDEELDDFVQWANLATEVAAKKAKYLCFPEELCKPIVRVSYAKELEGASRRIRRAVGDRAFLFETQLIAEPSEAEATLLSGTQARKLMAQRGLSAFLPEVLDEETDEQLITFCAELLDNPEPQVVIGKWREDFGLGE